MSQLDRDNERGERDEEQAEGGEREQAAAADAAARLVQHHSAERAEMLRPHVCEAAAAVVP